MIVSVVALRVAAHRYTSTDFSLTNHGRTTREITVWEARDTFIPGLQVGLIASVLAGALVCFRRINWFDPAALALGIAISVLVYPVLFVPWIHEWPWLGAALLAFGFIVPVLVAAGTWGALRAAWRPEAWPTWASRLLIVGAILAVVALFIPTPFRFATSETFDSPFRDRGIDTAYAFIAGGLTLALAFGAPRLGRAGASLALAWASGRLAGAVGLWIRGNDIVGGRNLLATVFAFTGAIAIAIAAVLAARALSVEVAPQVERRPVLARLGAVLAALSIVGFLISAARFPLGGDLTYGLPRWQVVPGIDNAPPLTQFPTLAPGVGVAAVGALAVAMLLRSRRDQLTSGAALGLLVGLVVYPTLFVLAAHDKAVIGSGLMAIGFLLPVIAIAATLIVLETRWQRTTGRDRTATLLLGASLGAVIVSARMTDGSFGGSIDRVHDASVICVALALLIFAPRLGAGGAGLVLGWAISRAAWAVGLTRLPEPNALATAGASASAILLLAATMVLHRHHSRIRGPDHREVGQFDSSGGGRPRQSRYRGSIPKQSNKPAI